jgi:hypothetical protein
MIQRLVQAYEDGAITGYQLMIDALDRLDLLNPDLVMSPLPDEILDEITAYANRYDPRRQWVGPVSPPTEDQVRAADTWIQKHRPERSEIIRP